MPVSPHSRDYGPGCFDHGPLICGPNDFFVKPYSVGGIVDVHLPLGFSAEAGFQYERFHQDLAHGLIAPHGGNVNFGELYGVSANGWLFPCLLKYTLGRRRLAPFADAGATLRHLGAFDGKGIQLDFNSQPQPISVHFESGRNLDVAITAGVGLRWRLAVLDISPEIRFLRWTSQYYQPVQNQAMLTIGITFPARR